MLDIILFIIHLLMEIDYFKIGLFIFSIAELYKCSFTF